MNIRDPRTQIGVIVVGLLLASGFGWVQSCVGDHYEAKADAIRAEAQAQAALLKDQISRAKGLEAQAKELQETTLMYKKLYEAARGRISPPPGLPPPPGQLSPQLEELGLAKGVTITKEQNASVLVEADAALIWTMGQRNIREAQLAEALLACDTLQVAQVEVIKTKDLQLTATNGALDTALLVARKREEEADALRKSLRVEQGKRWQKYLWAAGGAAAVWFARK
jgi:hypothetical protein